MAWVRRVLEIRSAYKHIIVNELPHSFIVLHDPNEQVLAFARVSVSPKKRIAIVTNMNFSGPSPTEVTLDGSPDRLVDLLTSEKYSVTEGRLRTTLQPGQCIVFEY